MLVGLASKNAILIVEFAKHLEEQGRDRVTAVLEAARLRLRPIVMTSIAFIMGVLPLVLADGAGAEVRRAMGAAVFSGMIGVTVFGLLLTPVFYVLVRRAGDECRPCPRRLLLRLLPMRKFRFLLAPVAAAVLAACAVGPNYHAPETKAAEKFDSVERHLLHRGGRRAVLADLRRPDARPAGRHGAGGELRPAHRAVARRRGARAAARCRLRSRAVSINAGGGYTKTRFADSARRCRARRAKPSSTTPASTPSGSSTSSAACAAVSKPATPQLGAVEAAQRDAQVIVTAEVTRTYFELRGFQQQLDVARRNVVNQQVHARPRQARLDAGSGTEFDTARAQAQLSATLGTIAPLEAAVARSIHRLSVLVGREPGALRAELAPPQDLPPLPGIVPVGDPAGLLRRRPDIRIAERELAGATARDRRRGRRPVPARHVHRQRRLRRGLLGRPGRSRHRMPTCSLPAFPGPSSTSATCRRASAPPRRARKAPCCAMKRPCCRPSRKPRIRWSPMPAPATAWCTTRRRCSASNTAADLARVRYENGASDFLQVLDAERTLLESEDRLARSRTEAATSLIAVYKSLGGGWDGTSPN